MYNKKRHAEKVQMKKTLKMHQEKKTKSKDTEKVQDGAVPAYLLDREGQTRAKVLSNMIKQKRKEKAVSYVTIVVTLTYVNKLVLLLKFSFRIDPHLPLSLTRFLSNDV